MLMKFKCKRKELKSNIIIVSKATQKHKESILMLDFSYYTSIYAIKLQRRPWEGKEDVKNRRDKEAQCTLLVAGKRPAGGEQGANRKYIEDENLQEQL